MSLILTCAAAAEMAGVPESTIRRWTRENRCPGMIRDGRRVLIHRVPDLEVMAAAKMEEAFGG